jgi:hypothetical protein
MGGLSFNDDLLVLLVLAPVALELVPVDDGLIVDDSWPVFVELLLLEPPLVLVVLLSYESVRREFRDRLERLGATTGIGDRPRSVRDELNDVDALDVLGVDVKLIL